MDARRADATDNTMSAASVGSVFQFRDVHGNVAFTLPTAVPSGVNGLRPPAPEFVGRGPVLEELLALVDPVSASGVVARVSAVAGLGGVGKTELAVQAAHTGLARGWFPGGVLAINLHGYEPDQRLDAGTALGRLLRRLGVPGEHVPNEVEERAELYRAVLHAYRAEGRAVLVVLDNASPDTPVAELLPGVGSVIVTSRHTPPRLGGRLLDLDVLQPAEGMEMLARLLELKAGRPDPRLIAQEADAERVVGLCGGLPLAIEVVAALLAAHPRKPLAATVARLEADPAVLGEVDAVLRLSYECLAPAQQRVLRLMTVNPGPQVPTPAIAALTGLPEEQVLTTVEALAEAHLIAEGERRPARGGSSPTGSKPWRGWTSNYPT
ncbi:hypothetical protein [Spirillospora sp. CA-294931]|uniref:hypothetical protein n=1 Tax=Spirillospora sp. CA-294931 TaxID=3240042 RepID=UPI003D92E519